MVSCMLNTLKHLIKQATLTCLSNTNSSLTIKVMLHKPVLGAKNVRQSTSMDMVIDARIWHQKLAWNRTLL